MTTPSYPSLDELRQLRVLRDVDVHFARAMARLVNEADPLVVLGAAVASRAPGAGHVCAELRSIRQLVRLEDADGSAPVTWPDPDAWLESLQGSPLVRVVNGDMEDPDGERRPLVLHDDRLYLQRYWCHQLRLLTAFQVRAAAEAQGVDDALLSHGLDRLFPPTAERDDGRQRVAAAVAVLRKLAVVTGGPGTGKTTTVVRILALLLEQARRERGREPARDPRIALAAPTGKAAARMVEAIRSVAATLPLEESVRALIPDSAFTLHRLLGVNPERPTRLRHHAGNPIAYDVVVVDEASMVDLALFAKLMDAVPPHARVILLGDRDQLTSVEAGAILGDVCGSGHVGFSTAFAERVRRVAGDVLPVSTPGSGAGMWECVVRLTHSHRFSEHGGIGALASAINAGDGERASVLLDGARAERGGELAWIDVPSEARDASCLKELAVRGYAEYLSAANPLAMLRALDAFRVLCAHRGGAFGVHELNERIAAWLREATLLGRESADSRGWWHGRPIIVTENDYQLDLFNGDTGLILVEDGVPRAWFRTAEDGVRSLSPTRLPAHDSVFAMTVHKSQGSEFREVAVVLPQRRSPILTRELLYTGVTRARERVTLVGSAEVLRHGIAERVQRASGISDALWNGGQGAVSSVRGETNIVRC